MPFQEPMENLVATGMKRTEKCTIRNFCKQFEGIHTLWEPSRDPEIVLSKTLSVPKKF